MHAVCFSSASVFYGERKGEKGTLIKPTNSSVITGESAQSIHGFFFLTCHRSERGLPGHPVQSETAQARDRSQTRRAERRADMLPEIAAAVGFLSSLLRTRGCVNEQRLQVFRGALQAALTEHYKHHWFPEKPSKGSGYRCIRINHKMDPIISKVASQIGLSQPQLHRLLPSELTLWVDPYEVSYRIGEDGSICVLYQEAPVATSYGLLTCKNQMILGRSSPSKNYIMAVSS